MSFYEQQIILATKCKLEDAAEIEEIMRFDIFHSTLDWVPAAQFNKAAREAWGQLQFMRSPEGVSYIKQLEDEFLK